MFTRTVFISHSRYDDAQKKWFSYVLSGVDVNPIFIELTNLKGKYEGKEIRDRIKSTLFKREVPTALFVILGDELTSPSRIYTHNWVNFEVGLAASDSMQVWVMEQEGKSINFSIPYVTDYMTYVLDNDEDGQRMIAVFKRTLTGKLLGLPSPITCTKCHASYSYWNDKSEITCPVCRQSTPVIRKALKQQN